MAGIQFFATQIDDELLPRTPTTSGWTATSSPVLGQPPAPFHQGVML